VQVVAQVIGPHAARVLVEAHGPVRHHVDFRIGIQLGEGDQLIFLHAAHFAGFFHRVLGDKLRKLIEAHRRGFAAVRVLRRSLTRIGGAQAVTDVSHAFAQRHVILQEGFIDLVVLNNVVGDEVEDHQIALRCEHYRVICQLKAAMTIGGKHRHFDVLTAQTTCGDT
jgi:hypothetical protein